MTTSATAPASPAPPEKKESLFQLSEDLNALDQLLTESEGEVTPEIQEWLDEYSAKLATKVDSVAWFWRTIEARIAGFKKIEQDLTAKRKTEENKFARLKTYLLACLHYRGVKELAGQTYKLAVQANSGRSFQLLEPYLSHPELLPEQFRRTVTRVEPDLEALKAATIAAGDTLTGLGPLLDDPVSPAPTIPMAVLHPAGSHVRLR